MHAVGLACLLVLLIPAAAAAQNTPPKTGGRGPDITKEEYVERAKQRAAARFDQFDTDRNGVLSADERRAARAKRKSQPQAQ